MKNCYGCWKGNECTSWDPDTDSGRFQPPGHWLHKHGPWFGAWSGCRGIAVSRRGTGHWATSTCMWIHKVQTGQIPSLLDYLFTDNEYVVGKLQCTSLLGKSDDVCIQFDYLAQHQTQLSLQPKLNYWKGDFAAIRKELSNYDWEVEFLNRDVSECWHILRDKLTSLSDKFVPPKQLNSAKRGNCGISKETVKEIKKREKAWIRYKSSGSDRHWRVYKSIRNRVVRLIRNDKEEHQKKLIRGFRNNPKRFYGYIHEAKQGSKDSSLGIRDGEW